MRTVMRACVVMLGVAVSGMTAPVGAAAPGDQGPGLVAVQCQVWASNGFGMGGMPGMGMGFGMKQWAGTVIGRGPDEGAARADAERQMWGPYGMSPELRDCVPA
ncbi:hypothetical protein [Mycobacterium sp. 360MFTsu5.1]|uniref:hypothetical protein n=1 Tax=Mycobacterium sp. 360MFTsu5.1 TaxID=1172186 RepID=UPI00035D5A83|nr:hypothetical protein [Mycobacterium sp. 360MFTsu5.1]